MRNLFSESCQNVIVVTLEPLLSHDHIVQFLPSRNDRVIHYLLLRNWNIIRAVAEMINHLSEGFFSGFGELFNEVHNEQIVLVEGIIAIHDLVCGHSLDEGVEHRLKQSEVSDILSLSRVQSIERGFVNLFESLRSSSVHGWRRNENQCEVTEESFRWTSPRCVSPRNTLYNSVLLRRYFTNNHEANISFVSMIESATDDLLSHRANVPHVKDAVSLPILDLSSDLFMGHIISGVYEFLVRSMPIELIQLVLRML